MVATPCTLPGDDGAYVVVSASDSGRAHAARVPIHETFRVYVDVHGILLRTDHTLRLGGATATRLHYRLERED